MSERFEVGEIAEVLTAMGYWHDCEIIGGLIFREASSSRTLKNLPPALRYAIRCEGILYHVVPEILRKKKPPEEKSSWEHIERITHWRPIRETV